MGAIYCEHRWTDWFDTGVIDGKRWRICNGLCGKCQLEGDEDPKIIIARSE